MISRNDKLISRNDKHCVEPLCPDCKSPMKEYVTKFRCRRCDLEWEKGFADPTSPLFFQDGDRVIGESVWNQLCALLSRGGSGLGIGVVEATAYLETLRSLRKVGDLK